MTDVCQKKEREEKGLNVSQHKLKLCFTFKGIMIVDCQFTVCKTTLSPSTRTEQNASSSFLIFFPLHEFAHFNNMNRLIPSNISFVPSHPPNILFSLATKSLEKITEIQKTHLKAITVVILYLSTTGGEWGVDLPDSFPVFS